LKLSAFVLSLHARNDWRYKARREAKQKSIDIRKVKAYFVCKFSNSIFCHKQLSNPKEVIV
jgi:hypothetical protein